MSVKEQEQDYNLIYCNCQTHVGNLLLFLGIQRKFHKGMEVKDITTKFSSSIIQLKKFQLILTTTIPGKCADTVLKIGEKGKEFLLLILANKEKVMSKFLEEFHDESKNLVKISNIGMWAYAIKLLELLSKVLLKYILISKGCQEEDAECYSYFCTKAVALVGTAVLGFVKGKGLPGLLAAISAWIISEIVTNLAHEMLHYLFKESENVWLQTDFSQFHKNCFILFNKFSGIISKIEERFDLIRNSKARKEKRQ